MVEGAQGFYLTDRPLLTRPKPACMAQSPLNVTTPPVDIKEGGRGSTMDRQKNL